MNFKEGNIKGVVVKELERYYDHRGFLVETFRLDWYKEMVNPLMSYLSCTRPGVARGPHEHVEQTDIFCFVGPGNFWIKLWDNRADSITNGNYQEIVAGEDRLICLIVPPGVVHGYKNISDKDGMVLNFPDKLYKGWGKEGIVDEIRHEDKGDEFYLDFIKGDG